MEKKILIIDDEPDIQKAIESRLKANGHAVFLAGNGVEGLKKVSQSIPDLIILDFMMPIMDGFEFFKQIKRNPDKKISSIPILLLTGRGKIRGTFESLDVDAFLEKPCEMSELLSVVSLLLYPKALILSVDQYTVDKITQALKGYEYNVIDVVNTENDLAAKAKDIKYNIVIVHLPYVKKEPADFASFVSQFKNKTDTILLYCDANTRGAEQDDAITIETIAKQWKNIGFENFFDARISESPLKDLLRP